MAQMIREIDNLVAENQTLDWDIPSECERKMMNIARIDALRGIVENDPFSRHARTAVASIFPSSSTSASTFVPIRRGHLTLVHSKE